jgi:hypothetical protein
MGVEVVGNTLYGGNGQIATGAGTPARRKDNQALPLSAALPPRPQPAVPSIYEWQQQRKARVTRDP